MKKGIKFVACFILIAWVVGFVFAAAYAFADISIPAATSDFYVNDFANVFSEDENLWN